MKTSKELPGLEKATVIERDQHRVSRKDISPNALKVLYRLGEAGYHAFLVGGGVRDLLLGNKPKDFDVATDATPEDLKELFRNARIIGRRFKIVHIRFGREILEVTTFRAHHKPLNEIDDDVPRRQIRGLDSAHSSTGMILRDNVYGDIDEDALRRDFTVNALYYTVDGFQVLDFSSGVEDLEQRQMRVIGDPVERYKEDPVRMLRAVRFAAKLDFAIAEKSAAPINRLAHLLGSISPARLFDETLKLFTAGFAVPTFKLLQEYEVGEYLIGPTLDALDTAPHAAVRLVELALENTDSRIAEGKSVTPAFLFAALLWPVLQLRLADMQSDQQQRHQEFHDAANATIMEQLEFTAVPKRFTMASREIWELQLRLQRRNKRSIDSAFSHPRFRAAYDFLLLREEAGEDLDGLGQWWTDYQIGDTKQRGDMLAVTAKPRNRRRKRSRRKSAGN